MIGVVILLLFNLLLVGLWKPSVIVGPLQKLGAALGNMAANRFAVLVVFVGGLLAGPVLTFFLPLPEPKVHDEFAYLLQADTFAHGRLANPTHPFSEHFETFHVIQKPSYVAKFPPGQAMFLAAGQMAGKPIYGVWLSTALAVAAIFWMLQAVMRPAWALAGALLALCNPQTLMWEWNFWNGSVALLAGALLFGGIFRMMRGDWKLLNAAAVGAGISLLALSRPFEGAIISALALAWLLIVCVKQKIKFPFLLRQVWPGAVVLAAALGFTGYYNVRVTGSALTMPYVLYEKNYTLTPVFLWQKESPEPPKFTHQLMHDFYEKWAKDFRQQQTFSGFVSMLKEKAYKTDRLLWTYAFSRDPWLSDPPPYAAYTRVVTALAWLLFLLPLPWVLRREAIGRGALLLIVGFVVCAILPITYLQPHYAAPVVPLLILLSALSVARLSEWKFRNEPAGQFFAIALTLIICAASVTIFVKNRKLYGTERWEYWRPGFAADISKEGKKNLILVRYGENHILDDEWVYNGADLDNAPVVWTRDMGRESDAKLMEYFKDRNVWLLQPEDQEHLVTRLR